MSNYTLSRSRRAGNSESISSKIHPSVTLWAQKIINVSGSAPSVNTQQALSSFYTGLESTGLLSKMIMVNCFAPDSLSASMQPLISSGLDPWVNHGFVDADLTNDGLVGNGSSKYVETGVSALGTYTTSSIGGMTFYISKNNVVVPASGNFTALGLAGGTESPPTSLFSFQYDGTLWYFMCHTNTDGGGRLSASLNNGYSGYVSCNAGNLEGTGNKQAIYTYTPQLGHSTVAAITGSANAASLCKFPLALFAYNLAGTIGGYSTKKLSFFAIHKPLSSSESQKFALLVQTLRTNLKGGYVHFDAVLDWARRVVVNGGAYPSASIPALQTFYAGLRSNGLLPKMKSVNCFVPDNLSASLTPLISNGNDIWTNTNFVDADLTVNGLKGDGVGKYLNTGITPSATFSSIGDGGITIYNPSDNINTATYDVRASSPAAVMSLYLSNGGTTYWDAYDESTGRISAANSAFHGYTSANRTPDGASNSSSIFIATGSNHRILVSSVVTPAGSLPTVPLYVYTSNTNGTVAGSYSNKRYSFVAVHSGLTNAESVTFFTLIQAMRTSLGGGYV